MIRLHKSAQTIELTSPAYTLTFDRQRPWLITVGTGTRRPVADIFVGASVDTQRGADRLEPVDPPRMERAGDDTVIVFRGRSSEWDEKRYVFVCRDDGLDYRVEVKGHGRLDRVHLWQGTMAGDAARLGLGQNRFRDGYERPYADLARGSRPHFATYVTARPTAAERDERVAWEDEVIDLLDDPARHGGLDSFLPAPWAIAVEPAPDEPWVAIGLAPKPDELQFSRFQYRAGRTFGFTLDYHGGVEVKGDWSSPTLRLLVGARDLYGAFRALSESLERDRLVTFPTGTTPSWWGRPVYDGSGQQAWEAEGGDPRETCTLASYLDAIARLETAGLAPEVIWVGPGWWRGDDPSVPDPLRWPDLPGFIGRQHALGRHVVLSWPLARIPDAALDRAAGQLCAAAGLGADGVRILQPAAPEQTVAEVRERLRRVRAAIRREQPEAILIAPTINPYFGDLVDMVPLGGLWTDRTTVEPMLRHRARIARLASPSWRLAVGDWHVPTREAWRELLELQRELGVPVLSYVTGLEQPGEPLSDEDLEAVARARQGYRE